MPLSAATLMPLTRKSTLPLEHGELEVTYKPRLLAETQAQPDSDDDDEQTRNRQADDICRVITGWDLRGPVPVEDLPGHPAGSAVADAETAVPLDPAVVRLLPQPLLSEIIMAVTLDAQPDPKQMQKRLQRRGSTPTAMPSNGRQDEPSPFPHGSMTS